MRSSEEHKSSEASSRPATASFGSGSGKADSSSRSAPDKITHSSSGPSLHDKDQTTDPWFVTEEKLANYKKTIETATERINREPQNPVPYIDRADAYLHVWMSKLAQEDSEKAISLHPDTVIRKSNSYCNRGEALIQLDKYTEALEDLNKAIAIDEENAEAYYFRGMAQERLGHVNLAIRDYEQARDFGFAPKGVQVDFAEYMASLQRAIKKEWHPPKGMESRKTVVQFKVYRSGLLDNLKVSTSSGLEATNEAAIEAVKATAPFQPLPKGSPRSVDIQFTFDYNVIKNGNNETRIGELANAEKNAQQKVEAAEKSGDQALLYNSLIELGDAYREKRNFYFAEASYKRAQDISENLEGRTFSTGKAIARQALVELDRGKKREAEELLTRSLDLALKAGKTQTDPDTGSVLRDYAKLLYKENRYDDVKKMYTRFKMI